MHRNATISTTTGDSRTWTARIHPLQVASQSSYRFDPQTLLHLSDSHLRWIQRPLGFGRPQLLYQLVLDTIHTILLAPLGRVLLMLVHSVRTRGS